MENKLTSLPKGLGVGEINQEFKGINKDPQSIVYKIDKHRTCYIAQNYYIQNIYNI